MQLTKSSSYGRDFARCGGLGEAVAEAIKEMGSDFDLKAVSCNGLAECNAALLRASKGVLKENFIEGMACDGGCIGGPGCLSHSQKNKLQFAKYEKLDKEATITDTIGQFEKGYNGKEKGRRDLGNREQGTGNRNSGCRVLCRGGQRPPA